MLDEMKHGISAFCFLLLATVTLAKDRSRITIRVLGTEMAERQVHHEVPGTKEHSSTYCRASNGDTLNCETTTTPATPPRTEVSTIPQAHVSAILPDGTQINLWCEQGWRSCWVLDPGTFPAEIKGNV